MIEHHNEETMSRLWISVFTVYDFNFVCKIKLICNYEFKLNLKYQTVNELSFKADFGRFFKSFFSFRWSEHYFNCHNSVGKYIHPFIFILADDLTLILNLFLSIFDRSCMIVCDIVGLIS